MIHGPPVLVQSGPKFLKSFRYWFDRRTGPNFFGTWISVKIQELIQIHLDYEDELTEHWEEIVGNVEG